MLAGGVFELLQGYGSDASQDASQDIEGEDDVEEGEKACSALSCIQIGALPRKHEQLLGLYCLQARFEDMCSQDPVLSCLMT